MFTKESLRGLGFEKIEKFESLYKYKDTPFTGHLLEDGSFKFQLNNPITRFNDLQQMTMLIDY